MWDHAKAVCDSRFAKVAIGVSAFSLILSALIASLMVLAFFSYGFLVMIGLA